MVKRGASLGEGTTKQASPYPLDSRNVVGAFGVFANQPQAQLEIKLLPPPSRSAFAAAFSGGSRETAGVRPGRLGAVQPR